MVMEAVKVRYMKVEIKVVFVYTPHYLSSANPKSKNKQETRKTLIDLVKKRVSIEVIRKRKRKAKDQMQKWQA